MHRRGFTSYLIGYPGYYKVDHSAEQSGLAIVCAEPYFSPLDIRTLGISLRLQRSLTLFCEELQPSFPAFARRVLLAFYGFKITPYALTLQSGIAAEAQIGLLSDDEVFDIFCDQAREIDAQIQAQAQAQARAKEEDDLRKELEEAVEAGRAARAAAAAINPTEIESPSLSPANFWWSSSSSDQNSEEEGLICDPLGDGCRRTCKF